MKGNDLTEHISPEINRAASGLAKGERWRDDAHALLTATRTALVRRLQRGFLLHLLEHGPATSDALRAAVAVPTGTDARVVGAAVRGLVTACLVVSVGRQQSRRAEAHARKIELWSVKSRADALTWLAQHPELSAPDPPQFPDD